MSPSSGNEHLERKAARCLTNYIESLPGGKTLPNAIGRFDDAYPAYKKVIRCPSVKEFVARYCPELEFVKISRDENVVQLKDRRSSLTYDSSSPEPNPGKGNNLFDRYDRESFRANAGATGIVFHTRKDANVIWDACIEDDNEEFYIKVDGVKV